MTGLTGSSALGWDGTQVSTRLRNMVTAAYPEAVGRRRAEEVSALATAELLQLVPSAPSTDSHQGLVQVCCVPPQPRASFTNKHKPKGEERLGSLRLWAALGRRARVGLLKTAPGGQSERGGAIQAALANSSAACLRSLQVF